MRRSVKASPVVNTVRINRDSDTPRTNSATRYGPCSSSPQLSTRVTFG